MTVTAGQHKVYGARKNIQILNTGKSLTTTRSNTSPVFPTNRFPLKLRKSPPLGLTYPHQPSAPSSLKRLKVKTETARNKGNCLCKKQTAGKHIASQTATCRTRP